MIRTLIEQIIREKVRVNIHPAVVKKVNEDTCHVTLTGGREDDFYRCRINAIRANKSDCLKIIPKEGSTVIVGLLPDNQEAVILSVSSAERLEYIMDDVTMIIDQDGFLLERDGEDLGTLMKDLFKAIGNMIFSTSYGPTTALLNSTEFQAIASRFDKVLRKK